MSETIRGFRGKDGPILLDYSGMANVPGAIQSIGALTAQPGDHFEVEAVDSTGRVATVKAVAKPGGNSGQNAALTAAQISALDGMFRVCAYDSDKDVAGAYAAFQAAFGLAGPGEEEPDEPVVPDIPDVPGVTQYTITNALTNVSTDNPVAAVTEGGAYMATLTADDGYTLEGGTVTVEMGGVDITATAYSAGVVNIASVTGNVVITAVAMEVSVDSGEVVMLKNISFDGTSYLDTGVIPESVNYRYVLGIQLPNKDIVTNKNIGGISMRDHTDLAQSAYWDIYWYCFVNANDYNADVHRVNLYELCMGLVNANGLGAGMDKGDGASTQPFDYPVYYNLGNGNQSMWLNEECTEPPVTGHFAAVTTATDFSNQSYYTDDEHPIDSIWLGKVHVTGIMNSLATEANTYAGVKFYCFKVYDSAENLIADMRPAKQGSTVGMWDNVRNKFFPATGTADYEEVGA